MNVWLASSRPTVLGRMFSTPGSKYSGSRSRSGAYIGCGNSGAAMMGSSGSGGSQLRRGASVTRPWILAGTVVMGLTRGGIIVCNAATSSDGATSGFAGSAWLSANRSFVALRNAAACVESVVPDPPPDGCATPGAVMTKCGWGETLATSDGGKLVNWTALAAWAAAIAAFAASHAVPRTAATAATTTRAATTPTAMPMMRAANTTTVMMRIRSNRHHFTMNSAQPGAACVET